ncbi:hypothetical protein [Halolamina sediminis]|uniref:hypothetical protein n=1 Tax=Halolamina sediminis TaxID=1480675 RepID=UPI0006B5E560|nr:hypothetical protein [Halolamina sediminis]
MPSDRSRDDESDSRTAVDVSDLDQEALYRTVRQAVQDAILDAVGTIALVTVGGALAFVGGSLLVRTATESGLSIGFLTAGIWLLAIGLYVVGSSLGVVQPVRDWL